MTRDAIIDEMHAIQRDLVAFQQARTVLQVRLLELEATPERQAQMADWPVFKIVDNGLIVAVVRCEGLLEDYQKLLDQEEVPNNVVKLERP